MLLLFLLLFVVLADARTCQEDPTKFRPDYKYVSEINGWLKLHRAPTNWLDARARCQLEGADLASPSSELMLQAIIDISGQASGVRCGIYTGINAWFSEGDYTSIEGTPLWDMSVEFANTQTCPRQVTHPCTVLLPTGTIDMVNCKHLYPFMCYRSEKKEIQDMCECGTPDPEYKYYEETGQCYKFHLQPQTWSNAYKICLSEGGHLAIINSPDEAKVISSIFEQHPSNTMLTNWRGTLLLGFKKLHGTWSTIHGQSLGEAGYASWHPGEPNSSPHPVPHDEELYCGAMYRSGLLDDIWCDYTYAFICEIHPSGENHNEPIILIDKMLRRDSVFRAELSALGTEKGSAPVN